MRCFLFIYFLLFWVNTWQVGDLTWQQLAGQMSRYCGDYDFDWAVNSGSNFKGFMPSRDHHLVHRIALQMQWWECSFSMGAPSHYSSCSPSPVLFYFWILSDGAHCGINGFFFESSANEVLIFSIIILRTHVSSWVKKKSFEHWKKKNKKS